MSIEFGPVEKVSFNGGWTDLSGKISHISFDHGLCPPYVKTVGYPWYPTDATITCDCNIDAGAFAKVFGLDLSPMRDFTVECSNPYSVQIRRHKKKRINKKWANRYGYKIMFKKVVLTDIQMRGVGEEYELIGRPGSKVVIMNG